MVMAASLRSRRESLLLEFKPRVHLAIGLVGRFATARRSTSKTALSDAIEGALRGRGKCLRDIERGRAFAAQQWALIT